MLSRKLKRKNKSVGYKRVVTNEDSTDIFKSERSSQFVIVDATDWKHIFLENLIAKLQTSGTRYFANAKDSLMSSEQCSCN